MNYFNLNKFRLVTVLIYSRTELVKNLGFVSERDNQRMEFKLCMQNLTEVGLASEHFWVWFPKQDKIKKNKNYK